MARPARSLAGQRILITGAARGIGAESARRLARGGARVALVGLEPTELEAVAGECGPGSMWLEADITRPDQLEASVSRVVQRMGGLDVVIANAGIGGGGLVRLSDPVAFERIIEVNLLGSWRTIRACLPPIMRSRGYVLVVASMAAVVPAPGMAAYAASKAGIEAFANSLRLEMTPHGVDVGVAYFSWIATDLVAGADEHPAFRGMRASLPGPGGRTYPVSLAVDEVVRGVTRRSRWVTAPRWVRGALLARGLLSALPARGLLARRIRELDERAEADVHSRGASAASRPVGPGGAAAMEAGEAPALSESPEAAAG